MPDAMPPALLTSCHDIQSATLMLMLLRCRHIFITPLDAAATMLFAIRHAL